MKCSRKKFAFVHVCYSYIDSVNFELQAFSESLFHPPVLHFLSASVFSYLIVFVLSKSYCLSYNISPLLEMGTSILYLHIQLFHLSLLFLSLPLFLCCQLAKYFMHVQQVPHILNEHPYDDVAVSTFLDLDAASPGTTANLYISVQSQ